MPSELEPPSPGNTPIVADTSVLINFLKVDRMDLIGTHPSRFLVLDHVAEEISEDYPQQYKRFEASLAAGYIGLERVTDPTEVHVFLLLAIGNRLGAGERAAIAVALSRKYALAIDDRKAINRALREAGIASTRLRILRTQDIVVTLIQTGALSIAQADGMLADWAANHRFKLKITSFRALLGPSSAEAEGESPER
ncbi:glr4256 [Gloeobacter violaceus PCC 7421]|uniref:Glr4256 protein n=1 Tax=Gloeobacter violaceus (strain ATCC 29082 / PCC 7421) TaxID=251221 RepID=Q7NDH9_GLOVI|nr:glr4256 [Gloeobacter violaceus PCC 7421]